MRISSSGSIKNWESIQTFDLEDVYANLSLEVTRNKNKWHTDPRVIYYVCVSGIHPRALKSNCKILDMATQTFIMEKYFDFKQKDFYYPYIIGHDVTNVHLYNIETGSDEVIMVNESCISREIGIHIEKDHVRAHVLPYLLFFQDHCSLIPLY
jgi:hypothetical protein